MNVIDGSQLNLNSIYIDNNANGKIDSEDTYLSSSSEIEDFIQNMEVGEQGSVRVIIPNGEEEFTLTIMTKSSEGDAFIGGHIGNDGVDIDGVQDDVITIEQINGHADVKMEGSPDSDSVQIFTELSGRLTMGTYKGWVEAADGGYYENSDFETSVEQLLMENGFEGSTFQIEGQNYVIGEDTAEFIDKLQEIITNDEKSGAYALDEMDMFPFIRIDGKFVLQIEAGRTEADPGPIGDLINNIDVSREDIAVTSGNTDVGELDAEITFMGKGPEDNHIPAEAATNEGMVTFLGTEAGARITLDSFPEGLEFGPIQYELPGGDPSIVTLDHDSINSFLADNRQIKLVFNNGVYGLINTDLQNLDQTAADFELKNEAFFQTLGPISNPDPGIEEIQIGLSEIPEPEIGSIQSAGLGRVRLGDYFNSVDKQVRDALPESVSLELGMVNITNSDGEPVTLYDFEISFDLQNNELTASGRTTERYSGSRAERSYSGEQLESILQQLSISRFDIAQRFAQTFEARKPDSDHGDLPFLAHGGYEGNKFLRYDNTQMQWAAMWTMLQNPSCSLVSDLTDDQRAGLAADLAARYEYVENSETYNLYSQTWNGQRTDRPEERFIASFDEAFPDVSIAINTAGITEMMTSGSSMTVTMDHSIIDRLYDLNTFESSRGETVLTARRKPDFDQLCEQYGIIGELKERIIGFIETEQRQNSSPAESRLPGERYDTGEEYYEADLGVIASVLIEHPPVLPNSYKGSGRAPLVQQFDALWGLDAASDAEELGNELGSEYSLGVDRRSGRDEYRFSELFLSQEYNGLSPRYRPIDNPDALGVRYSFEQYKDILSDFITYNDTAGGYEWNDSYNGQELSRDVFYQLRDQAQSDGNDGLAAIYQSFVSIWNDSH